VPRRIKRTKPIKERIIAALREGLSPTYAVRKARLSRAEAYRWRKEDSEFKRQWEEAVAEGVDLLEDEAQRRAVDGYVRDIYNKNGEVVGHVRKYSDSLLMFLLKSRRPERYNRPVEPVESVPRVERRISLEEARARLLQLGLPVPEIEGDYEGVDAPGSREGRD
jgi:hypothetical protein